MPNIASVLKSEISRIARKEVRSEIQSVRKAATTHRREIAALKRRIAQFDRQARVVSRTTRAASGTREGLQIETPTRFVAKGLISLRKRLGLSAADMARLLNVSMQSVYNWEHKKATPRKEQVAAIVALRSVGKKDALERLEASEVRNAAGKRAPKTQRKKRISNRKAPKLAKRSRAK